MRCSSTPSTFLPWTATTAEATSTPAQDNLARLLARRADGIHFAPFEQGKIGPDLFKAACDMMLEGLVSKRRDSRYRAGPSRDWIKTKNPKSPAMNRAKDAF
jgi:bifunctional non-homologous end joining protein LigD